MPKKHKKIEKRRFYLSIILLCIFAIASIVGTSILENLDKQPSNLEEKPKGFVERTMDALGSPFENLLKTKDKLSKKEKDVTLKIPILMYHYVEIVTDERDTIRQSLNTEPKVFEQQLLTLKNEGYNFIWPSEIPEILINKDLQYGKYVVISFDDGYKDFYTDAYPILKKHNIKAVNYVSYFLIDTPNYMETPDIEEIVKDNLVEIGSHTLRHTSLTSVTHNKAREEIFSNKKYLETKFKTKVDSFAYPYGYYDASTIELVKAAGYTNAVTINSGNMVTNSNLFELGRVRPGNATGKSLINWIN